MGIDELFRRLSLDWPKTCLHALFAIIIPAFPLSFQTASAQTLSSRTFDQASGLKDLDPVDLLELPCGALFVRSQGGTFLFDGKVFLPLGPRQGVTGDTVFKDLVAVPDEGLMIGVQGDRILIAKQPSPFSLQNLHFLPVENVGNGYSDFRMARPYGHGALVLAGNQVQYIELADPAKPHFARLPTDIEKLAHLPADLLVMGVIGNTVLLSFGDGRVCVFAVGHQRCWSQTNGLPKDEWGGFAGDGHDKVYFRSGRTFATIDLGSGRLITEPLPDTSQALEDFPEVLKLQMLPDGDLLTQSQHGAVIRHEGHWHVLHLYDGNSLLWAIHADQAGSLWLGLVGQGLVQYFGYGRVSSWNREVGLLPGITWNEARDSQGNLWIGTDGGLDRINSQGRLEAIFSDHSAEVVAPAPDGRTLWVQVNQEHLERIDLSTGKRSQVQLTGINTFRVNKLGDVWIATRHGLYRLLHDAPIGSPPLLSSSPQLAFTNIAFAGDGTAWLTGSGTLWHFVPGPGLQAVVTRWPRAHVELETLAIRDLNDVWVGSDDGLFQVTQLPTRPQVSLISTSRLPSQSINALAVDHERRVWVGTSNGVGVYDGVEWHGLDITNGLIGNDVAQDAIYVDGDDSVWIGTSRGLSHVQDTASVLSVHPISPVVLSVSANNEPYEGQLLQNRNTVLAIQLGVNAYPSSTRIVYRYKLDPTDANFTETTQDNIVFPAMPPGTHSLQIEAIDPLSAQLPTAVNITVAVAFPWWEQRWFLALAACLMVLAVWLLIRLRTTYLLRQQRRLNDAIYKRTQELRTANQALEIAHAALTEQSQALALQATHDGLTGLLNRGAAQAALTEMLAATRETGLTVALIDIDHFKRFNDAHGHLVGDAVLTALGKRLRSTVRSTEIVGRYGGEEYILAIPIDDDLGIQRIQSIITSVTTDSITYDESIFDITVSAGVTAAQSKDTWESAIERADRALYCAKQQGRNRLVAFDDLLPEVFPSVS